MCKLNFYLVIFFFLSLLIRCSLFFLYDVLHLGFEYRLKCDFSLVNLSIGKITISYTKYFLGFVCFKYLLSFTYLLSCRLFNMKYSQSRQIWKNYLSKSVFKSQKFTFVLTLGKSKIRKSFRPTTHLSCTQNLN